jgi:hypothetical protein
VFDAMKIKHYLPHIGLVEIDIKEYPQEVYNLLKDNLEIDRLKKLSHLGILQDVFPGISHSRWDYTLMTLHFINEFSVKRLKGLSSTRKIFDLDISGRDVLYVLALIANTGHLPGTFGAEKGVLHVLLENNKIDDLLTRINIPKKSAIDYMRFNKVLLIYKLCTLFEAEKDSHRKKVLKFTIDLAKEFFIYGPKTQARKDLLNYFNIARRLSYLFLDSMYINLPIKIEYTKFSKELPKQLDTIRSMMSHYVRIVYHAFYHSDKARKKVLLWQRKIKNKLENEENHLDKLKEFLKCHSLKDLDAAKRGIGSYEQLLAMIIPNKFDSSFLVNDFRDKGIDSLEVKFRAKAQDANLLLLYIPGLEDPVTEDISAGEIYLDLWKKKTGNDLDVLFAFLTWIQDTFKTTAFGKGIITKVVIEQILTLLFPRRGCSARIDLLPDDFFSEEGPYMVQDDKVMYFQCSEKGYNSVLNNFKNRQKKNWNRELKEKYQEFKAIRNILKICKGRAKKIRNRRRYNIVIPGEVTFVGKTKNICQFDGCLIGYGYRYKKVRNIEIYFTEAKRGKRTSRFVAQNELKDKLTKIIRSKKKTAPTFKVYKLTGKNAYARVTFNDQF